MDLSKKNKIANTNSFINRILPIIYTFRKKQDDKFMNFLDKKYSILKDQNGEINKNELIQEINKFYYEDDISYHEEEINLRIANNNMNMFSHIIEDEYEKRIKKSTYFRSLINQYSNLKLDLREYICFNKEYEKLENAIENKFFINFQFQNENIEIFPIRIYTCPITSDIYVFGVLRTNDKNIFLNVYRIFEMTNPHIIQKKFDYLPLPKIEQFIHDFIIHFEYLDINSKLIE